MKELIVLLLILIFGALSIMVIQIENRKASRLETQELLRENLILMDSIGRVQYETQDLMRELHRELDNHIKHHR